MLLDLWDAFTDWLAQLLGPNWTTALAVALFGGVLVAQFVGGGGR
jgi:hypothetical protein